MDEWELAICEKIFSVIKEEEIIPDVILKQEVLPKEDWNSPQKIKVYNRLVEILDQHNIIEKRYGNNGYKIHVGSNALLFDSFQEYLKEVDKKQKELEEEKSLHKEKLVLEIETLKGQIKEQKERYLKLLVGAILVEIMNLLFIFLFK